MLYSIIKYEEFFARLFECICGILVFYSHDFRYTSYTND